MIYLFAASDIPSFSKIFLKTPEQKILKVIKKENSRETLEERLKKSRNCADIAHYMERKHKTPNGLLLAIMRVESSLNPYAVYGQKKGFHYSNQQEAIEKVNSLWEQGYRNVNVGCMQINLQFHRDKLGSLEQWFNPFHNIEYAAIYLNYLKKQLGSWIKAVQFYHSGNNPNYYEPYVNKVNQHLKVPLA